jgi:hypothetical protein
VLRHAGNARSFGGALFRESNVAVLLSTRAGITVSGMVHAPPIIIQSSVNFIISHLSSFH